MISEIDAALSRLLGEQTFASERIKVELDPPTKDWAARRSGPVLNLFLNDIREDMERRTADVVEVKVNGNVVARRPAERTFLFTYALSAWTSRPEDDHALLSAALLALLKKEYISEDISDGVLADLARRGRPAMLRVGGIMYSDRINTDLWSSIGGEFRPVIAITVSTLVPAGLPTPAGPPQTQPPKFSFQDTRDGGTSTVQGASPSDGGRTRTRASLADDGTSQPAKAKTP